MIEKENLAENTARDEASQDGREGADRGSTVGGLPRSPNLNCRVRSFAL